MTLTCRLLEKTSQDRSQTAQLMRTLVKRHYLLPEQYEAGLVRILEFAGDLLVDIPRLWEFIAELVGEKRTITFLRV